MHRTDSIYDDVPSERYQFPKIYLSRAEQCVGDWIIYLEPRSVRNTKGYFAVARVQEIIPDPGVDGMYLAIIERGSYIDFGDYVPFSDSGIHAEQGILNEQGKISGRAQSAVRTLSAADFTRIVAKGLGDEDGILPRVDQPTGQEEFAEAALPLLDTPMRDRISLITNRAVRDRNFRKVILRAYDNQCAISGLRLINGGGRAEVEAAHIKPVEHHGPDIVGNGIALSGTAHWMFDRGLVGLSDDLSILISRQANDVEAVRSMINKTGKLILPRKRADHPRGAFITWHREHCFKA